MLMSVSLPKKFSVIVFLLICAQLTARFWLKGTSSSEIGAYFE